MTLEELGMEYLKEAEFLENKIKKLRRQLKKQPLNYTLKKDLQLLEEMRVDCKQTGNDLINYYNKEKKRYVKSHRTSRKVD